MRPPRSLQTRRPPVLGASLAAELQVPIDVQLAPSTEGSDSERVAALTAALGPVLVPERFTAVFVMGDVNTTLTGALTAARQGLPVIHLEAGLRCGDEHDPEEVNRKVVTQCASVHLASTVRAYGNLRAEGVADERIYFVGNSRRPRSRPSGRSLSASAFLMIYGDSQPV
jgi:UDP-N-acetylglucosamine 2-epimerase